METENCGEGKVTHFYGVLQLPLTECTENAIIEDKRKTCLSYLPEKGLCAYWKIQEFLKFRSCQRNNEQMNVSFLKTFFDPEDAVLCLFAFTNFCGVTLQLD